MSALKICEDCGSRTHGKTVTPGSIFIEILLWLFMIVPGLIYSIWRLTKRHRACHRCGSPRLVPLDTPVGRELASRFPETTEPR